MYCDFWNLSHAPFDQLLDLEYFFESEFHEEALARLLFVAEEQKKCAVFTGPAGTGKSLTLKVFQTILKRSPYQCESIDLLGLGEEEFLWQLCAQLRLGPSYSTQLPQLWRQLTDFLMGLQLTQGRLILLLDHVDQSRSECLKTIERLLHTGNQRFPALTIVTTSGTLNPGAATTVSQLSDLAIELGSFDQETTEAYIRYRLNCSGCSKPLFTADAMREIQKATEGTPEKINQICDLALLAGYEQNLQEIDSDVITRAEREIKGAPLTINRISEVMHGV
ncbi:AAA family ATPase [uncultured Gimesia sp.]|uniref:ExeA family protein n=1 Tax=uncultured Gimesia sp. TaxID=1678688 RepID=UPI0030DC543A|tara:strand:+ start:20269 stop:21105 length:837 start_codon:yes stop_codon:yes gene_type:complete